MKLSLNNSKYSKTFLFIILAIGLIFTYIIQNPYIQDPYIFSDDFRSHIWWLYKLHNPFLFPDDYLLEVIKTMSSPGINLIYYIGGYFGDLVYFSKLLVFPIVLVSLYYLFQLGKYLKGNLAGSILAILFLFTHYAALSEGLQRSFVFPFIIAFLYYFTKKDYLKSSIAAVLSLFFYPPVFVICCITYALSFIEVKKFIPKFIFNKNKLKYFIILCLLGLIILLPGVFKRKDVKLLHTKYIPWNKVVNMPEYKAGGRRYILEDKKFLFNSNINFLGDNLRVGSQLINSRFVERKVLLITALIFLLLLRKKTVNPPKEFYQLLMAGFIAYFLALALLFILHGPSRYLFAPWSMFLLSFIALNFENAIKTFVKAIDKIFNKETCKSLLKTEIVTLISFYLFIMMTFPLTKGYIKPFYINHYWYENLNVKTKLFEFIKTLPDNVLIAGPLRTMDYIPTISKKSVYTQEEFTDFTDEIKRRTYAFYDAYYSSDINEVKKFCNAENIDYMLVEPEFYENQKINNAISQPYNEYIHNKIDNKNLNEFALLKVPYSEHVFNYNNIFIFKCNTKSSKENKTYD